ncbi:MAG: pre-peptidase C-terminal domain-containing protein, partial [Rhodobiaceae bacterium]|nr:pre-peptidase C-terminal domain-containing protein [Rhodobiaceae bacterium]
MANIASIGSTINGTAFADILVAEEYSGTGSTIDTIKGFGGNDVIFGDHDELFVDNGAGNGTIATALSIDASFRWSTKPNPDVGDTTIPYTTVLATGGEERDLFSVTVETGQTITVDLDYGGDDGSGGGVFDSVIRLLDASSGELAFDDDAIVTSGGLGSTSNRDSYLTYTNNTGSTQTYFIEVGQFSAPATQGNPIYSGSVYMLNVSVTNHASTNVADFSPDNIDGGDGNDIIYGLDGADTINGGAGNDLILGGEGDDLLKGNGGIDRVLGEGGADRFLWSGAEFLDSANNTITGETLDGGTGTDTLVLGQDGPNALDFSGHMLLSIEILEEASTSVQTYTFNANQFNFLVINWHANGAYNPLNINMWDKSVLDLSGTVINNFESLDEFYINGDGDSETIRALNGASVYVTAGGGNDFVSDHDTNQTSNTDVYDGGTGTDTIEYSFAFASSDYVFDLGAEKATYLSTQIDVIRDFENINVGGAATVIGDGKSNVIHAIDSGASNGNSFSGMGGNDTLEGGAGDDTLDGGAGGDVLNGGSGNDTASYANSTAGVNVQLQYGVALGGEAAGDSFISIERLTGSGYNDTLYGNPGANIIRGGGGSDHIKGLNGADNLYGDGGDDWLYVDSLDNIALGGGGTDRLIVVGSGGVTNAVGANGIEIATGNVGNDVFDGIAATVNLTLKGLSGDDTLTGGSGDDYLYGGAGADSLSGGPGTDRLFIDEEDIAFNGGAGLADRVIVQQLASATTGVTVNMGAWNLEIAYGNLNDDTFDGSASGDPLSLYGRQGQDTLIGGSSNDRLYGDNNDAAAGDILNGGKGNDYLYGGENGAGGFAERDQFVFATQWGSDRIFDFANNGAEKIDFS